MEFHSVNITYNTPPFLVQIVLSGHMVTGECTIFEPAQHNSPVSLHCRCLQSVNSKKLNQFSLLIMHASSRYLNYIQKKYRTCWAGKMHKLESRLPERNITVPYVWQTISAKCKEKLKKPLTKVKEEYIFAFSNIQKTSTMASRSHHFTGNKM